MKIIVFLILAFIPLVSCGSWDYSIDLGGGYRLVRTNSDTIVIFAPSGIENKTHRANGLAVPPKIISCVQSGDMIWGEVRESRGSELGELSVNGWFSLDVKTGDCAIYLKESLLIDYLKRSNVSRIGEKKIL